MVATALDVKLGVEKHFVPMNREEKSDPGNTQYKMIQEMFCGNTDKIKAFMEHCDIYIMAIVLIITTTVNYGASHTRDIWVVPDTILCLINYCSEFPLEHIAQFQK